MASTTVPFTSVGSGYTILTQVTPSSSDPTAPQQNSAQTHGTLQNFLKGEPKALGVVQIMIGVLTLLLGIVIAIFSWSMNRFSGVAFWGSLIHIRAGYLAVSASNKLNVRVVKAALVMNIFSSIAAGIAIIMFSLDLSLSTRIFCYFYDYRFDCDYRVVGLFNGVIGVLLVFSVLQLVISIIVSAFTCKATCNNEPTLNIINVVPNPDGRVPVVSSFPAHHTEPGISSLNAVAVSAPPLESPPAYTEKSQSYN